MFLSRGPAPFHGAPFFPFYRRRETVGYRGEKGEEQEREEGFQDRRVLLLLHAGPVDPVDVNRDGSTSQPCFVTGAMRRRHLPLMAFHSIPANVVVN